MAHATMTVNNYRHAIQQLATFLSTNATLVTDGEEWTILRHVEDNLLSTSTDMTLTSNRVDMLFRPEPKTEPNEASDPTVQLGSWVAARYIQWELRTTKAVTSLRLKAGSNASTQMPTQFRLQYADSAAGPWATAHTQASSPVWANYEERVYSGWAATGTHLHWRLLVDALPSGSSVSMTSMLCYDGTDIVNSSSEEYIFRGQGLAGTDEIYWGIRTLYNLTNASYWAQIIGLTGYTAAERRFYSQPGIDPNGSPSIALWDASMTAWFTANGRATVFAFLVSSVYESGGAGFFDPDTLPTEYPYPLFVGGSNCPTPPSYKYDAVAGHHSCFTIPSSRVAGTTGTIHNETSLKILDPAGSWVGIVARNGNNTYPGFDSTTLSASLLPSGFQTWTPGQNVGNGYTLFPLVLYQRIPLPSRFLGQLPLVKAISGSGNGSQNTGTIAGVDYIVFQNTFRTTEREYFAMVAE